MQGIIKAFSALAQEHRLAAYRLLVQAGDEGMPAGDIARELGIAASTLSFHLAQLSHAGLINQRRHGRAIIYSTDYHAMAGLIGFLTENCNKGDGCGIVPGCGVPRGDGKECGLALTG